MSVDAMDLPTSYQQVALELAEESGQRLLAWFGKTASSQSEKRDGSLVTAADLEVDHVIHDALRARFPQHGIVSEELSHTYQGAEYTWVIDPLDGTTNFANGLAYWGVSIALLHAGQPLLGVLEFPLLGQRFSAARGQGAWLNNRRLQVEPVRSLAELHGNQFFALDSRGYRYLDVRLACKPRILGSAAYDLAAVAAGVTVAAIQTTPKIWDVAAAWLICQEAGGAVGPLLDGAAVFPLTPGQDYGDRVLPTLFAASGGLWAQIRQIIRLKPGAERLAQRLAAQGWRLPAPDEPA